MFCTLSGLKKLGQPVPDSNLCCELKSFALQHTQVYVPFTWLCTYLPEKAGSVAFMRVTRNCARVSCLAHSRSVLYTGPVGSSGSVFSFSSSAARPNPQR